MTGYGKFLRLLVLVCFFASIFLVTAGPPARAQEVTVTAAVPDNAPQGSVNLPVQIKGSGFRKGAKAQWFITGTTNPGGVTVNSTAFVIGTELLADITIAPDAQTELRFDICVISGGRTGKGIELFKVTENTSSLPNDAPARASFRDLGYVGGPPYTEVDRIQSDGVLLAPPCTGQYADVGDPCQPSQGAVSLVLNDGSYFLRTLSMQSPHPTRYLVLDFTEGLGDSACLNLDVRLSNYPGRSPDATSPVNPDVCVDFAEVRLSAGSAFKHGAEYTSVGLAIDGPDLKQGRGKQPDSTQWNAKYYLTFVNPLRITFPDPMDPDTLILSTMDGLEQAELWTVQPKTGGYGTLLGRYRMPFAVTIVRVTAGE